MGWHLTLLPQAWSSLDDSVSPSCPPYRQVNRLSPKSAFMATHGITFAQKATRLKGRIQVFRLTEKPLFQEFTSTGFTRAKARILKKGQTSGDDGRTAKKGPRGLVGLAMKAQKERSGWASQRSPDQNQGRNAEGRRFDR